MVHHGPTWAEAEDEVGALVSIKAWLRKERGGAAHKPMINTNDTRRTF